MFLASYGLVMVALVHYFLPESLPQQQSLHPAIIGRNYSELFVARDFMTVALGSSLIYAAMLVYLAASGFVYLEMLGVPLQYFGLIFLTTVVGYFIGSASSARLASHFESAEVVRMGAILGALACFVMLVCSSLWPHSIWALMLPMMLYTAALGMVLPHAMNLALQPYPHMAGTASALLGFIQMAVSATASGVVGLLLSDSPAPMVWLMSALSGLGLLLLLQVHNTGIADDT